MAEGLTVVYVHGWSVHNTDTYGELPRRLAAEAAAGNAPPMDVRDLRLGKYVSFRDEVRLEDLSRGFEAALRAELGELLATGRRFVCITHSTGGPVARDWWKRYYLDRDRPCPMSHLIMLAPANFGSALAQLGKERVGRLKSWIEGIEPGQRVLDWLELGSPEAWELNRWWIATAPHFAAGAAPVFPFVLTGQSIDRKLYDNLNSYTGELGSDGVVRVPAANLNAHYVRLEQQAPESSGGGYEAPRFAVADSREARPTAFALLPGRSHSGQTMGILRSVKNDGKPHPTVRAVLDCLGVSDEAGYEQLRRRFATQNERVRERERVERHHNRLFPDNFYLHDACSMLIFRLRDDRGHTVGDFDLLFTGKDNDPGTLPPSFFRDRQKNSRDRGVITYFMNHDKLHGMGEVRYKGEVLRKALPGVRQLGMQVTPRPTEGFVHYLPAVLRAQSANIEKFIRADQTTLVEIVLRRVVHGGVFELTSDLESVDFRGQGTGGAIG